MKKQYFLLKTIRVIIALLMVIIFGIFVILVYKKMTTGWRSIAEMPE